MNCKTRHFEKYTLNKVNVVFLFYFVCYVNTQREISNKIQLGENLNPLRDISNVPSIDNVANLKDIFCKVDKVGVLWNKGEIDASLVRYIPSLSDVSRLGQIYSINHKKAYAAQTYTDKKSLECTVNLAANTYTNYSSMCVVLPIQIKKKPITQQTLTEQ